MKTKLSIRKIKIRMQKVFAFLMIFSTTLAWSYGFVPPFFKVVAPEVKKVDAQILYPQQKVIFLTTAGSDLVWTVPDDWSDENMIEVLGAGGGGRTGGAAGSKGGGGGAYAAIKVTGLSPGGSVNYRVGSGGTAGNNGGDTLFNRIAGSANTCADTVTLCAKGGGGGTSVSAGGAGGAVASNKPANVGFSGGTGGNGSNTGDTSGGGGGAAGPQGAGGNGGAGQAASPGAGGGGGAAATSTTAGAGSTNGGTGASNFRGVAGGTGGNATTNALAVAGTSGAGGGGGAATTSATGIRNGAAGGGNGGVWTSTHAADGVTPSVVTIGPGGGGGGTGGASGGTATGGDGGTYGGGGGGGYNTGGTGGQGVIVITYVPSTVTIKTVFLTTAGSDQVWTVPDDWSDDNEIMVLGAGGGGRTGGSSGSSGGGGGAFATSTVTGLSPAGSVNYRIGSGGTANNAGGDTLFNRTAGSANTCADTVSVCAKGGGGGGTGTTVGRGGDIYRNKPSYGGFPGGNGGAGNTTGDTGGGGGSAASPYGAGRSGGASQGANPGAGGGGGGVGGIGAAGSGNGGAGGVDLSGANGGAGAINSSNTLATAGTSGGGGGGGAGTTTDTTIRAGGNGSNSVVWTQTSDSSTIGPGGGGGGAGAETAVGTGSSGGTGGYGAGGGGSYLSAGSGGQGFIIIRYKPSGIAIGGTVYASEGGSNIGASKTISLYKNGSTLLGTDTTDGSGVYSINASGVVSGDILTAYIDGDAVDGSIVYVSDGTAKSDVHIFGGALAVRHDTGSGITNANLTTGYVSGDASDMVYTTDGSNNLTVGSNIELHVWTGDTYTPGATVTTQGTGDLHLDDSSTVTLGSATNVIADDIIADTGSTLNINASTNVDGDLSVVGTITGTGNVTVNGGDVTGDGTLNFTDGVFLVDGGGLFGGNTNWTFNELTFGDGVGGMDNDWYDDAWDYRKAITIDATQVSGSSNLTDFPVLVDITDSGLQASAQSDGDDILFTSSDGSTKLAHEIEIYTTATGRLTAWVKIPTLDYDDNTVIYMYYGNSGASSQQNATGVWDSNYMAVYHMNDNAANSTIDEVTSNNNNATYGYGQTTSNRTSAGKISSSLNFLNGSDYAASNSTIVLGANTTFSVWIKGTSFGSYQRIFETQHSDGYYLGLNNTGTKFYWIGDSGSGSGCSDSFGAACSTGTISAGQWYYLVGTSDGTSNRLYQDGVAQGVDTKASNGSTLAITMGSALNGFADEIRVSSVARSADWITTEYNNQSATSTFYTIGSEETSSGSSSLSLGTGTGSITVATTTIATNQTLDAGVSKTWILTASYEPFQLQGIFLASTSLFRYAGTNNATVTPTTYYDLEIAPSSGSPNIKLGTTTGQTITINNNFTINGAGNATVDATTRDPILDINGSFSIGSGDTFQASDSASFTVAKNFSNSGTFTHNNGTVTLDTTNDATISSTANMSFYKVTVTTAGKTLAFGKHTANVPTFSFDDLFTVTGLSGAPINIWSDTPTDPWMVDFNIAQTAITNVNVRDSHCLVGSLSVTFSSTNGGGGNNGTCWNISNLGADGTGSVASVEQGGGGGTARTGGGSGGGSGGTDGGSGGGNEQGGGGQGGGGGGGTP